MIKGFIESFCKLLVAYPERISAVIVEDNEQCDITIYAHPTDVGKLIGKEGRMVYALKTVVTGCKAKDNLHYRLSVKADE